MSTRLIKVKGIMPMPIADRSRKIAVSGAVRCWVAVTFKWTYGLGAVPIAGTISSFLD
jgi:hypothetical protein